MQEQKSKLLQSKRDYLNFVARTLEEVFGTMVGYPDSYHYFNKLYIYYVVKKKSTVQHHISLPML